MATGRGEEAGCGGGDGGDVAITMAARSTEGGGGGERGGDMAVTMVAR